MDISGSTINKKNKSVKVSQLGCAEQGPEQRGRVASGATRFLPPSLFLPPQHFNWCLPLAAPPAALKGPADAGKTRKQSKARPGRGSGQVEFGVAEAAFLCTETFFKVNVDPSPSSPSSSQAAECVRHRVCFILRVWNWEVSTHTHTQTDRTL